MIIIGCDFHTRYQQIAHTGYFERSPRSYPTNSAGFRLVRRRRGAGFDFFLPSHSNATHLHSNGLLCK